MTAPINPDASKLRRDFAERMLLAIVAREGVSDLAWENAVNKQRQVHDAVTYADLLYAELNPTTDRTEGDAWSRVPIEDTSP